MFFHLLTLLHSERPKLYTIIYNFGLSECNRVNFKKRWGWGWGLSLLSFQKVLLLLKERTCSSRGIFFHLLVGLNVFISILLQHVSHITTCKFLGLERKHIAYLVLLLFFPPVEKGSKNEKC